MQSAIAMLKTLTRTGKKSWLTAKLLCLLISPLAFCGCATAPPQLFPPAAKTLSFQISLNPSGKATTQWKSSNGNGYLGFYRIVINTLNSNLIGNQTAVTTNSDTWTDYFELNNGGWIRNDRIAPPSSPQPQQWTGPQPITPGTIGGGGTTITIALTLPDHYLGHAQQFNVSAITYIVAQANTENPLPIDSLGPQLSPDSAINYISFNQSVTNPNTLNDPLGDWATYPIDFPDLQTGDYQNFDISSLTVQVR